MAKADSPVEKKEETKEQHQPLSFPPRLVTMFADEIAKTVASRLPHLLPKPRRKKVKRAKKIENGIFLDTSAIIDGRIFDVIHLGLLNGIIVITEGVLLELKHIADAQDTVKRERGRRGLEYLEKLKKARGIRVHVLDEELDGNKKPDEVDERIIKLTKLHRGKIITCDYNLEKKANIQNVTAVNVNALANSLKVTAVPGQASHIKILHQGKDVSQGVGYLDDGTMIVVENGSEDVGRTVDVVVSRVIQTATGRILFAKRI
ncbi:MAG: TRAM domain-containing protein [Candidatus Levybacteria bacterium]|nr:TRAM domain-containing protein [Candidatus Levybacteria bacterium]